jgi:hypothetical protein
MDSGEEMPPESERERVRRERQREVKRESARRCRAAKKAAGLCSVCGKPRDGSTNGTGVRCGRCLERGRETNRRYEDRLRARRAAERGEEAKPARVYLGVCPHCRRKQLSPHGRTNDGRGYRYLCQNCGQTSSGLAPLERPDPRNCPCPYCGGPCTRHQARRLKRGGVIRQMYQCTVCGKCNTDLYPEPPRHDPADGPLRHSYTFGLNPAAQRNLIEYCNATGLGLGRAIRTIFRAANEAPVVRVSTARVVRDRDGFSRVVVTSPAARQPTPEETAALARYRLPDLRPETTRARSRRRGEHRHAPTVLVTAQVRVRLDDAAKAGLLKEMRRTGRTHQEAARALLARARP